MKVGWCMEQEIEVLMQGYQFRKFYEKKFEFFMNRYDLRKIDVEILTYLRGTQYGQRYSETGSVYQGAHITVSGAAESGTAGAYGT